MTLEEFLSHIKHKSLGIKLIKNNKVVLETSVGTFENLVCKHQYLKSTIAFIVPEDCEFKIMLDCGGCSNA